MALALNTANPLVSGNNVKLLIGVDPTSGALVDLARSGVSFAIDAGVTYVDTPIGKGVRCPGAGDVSKGFTFTEYSQSTQVAHEGTLLMVINKQTGTGSGGSQPARLPGSNTASNNMQVAFGISNGNVALNDANTSMTQVLASPAKNFTGDNQWHSIAIQQWNVAGWNTLQGNLFIDGVDAGASISTGAADTMRLNAFGKCFYASWAGDFVWMIWVNKKMTPTEIADWHASINTASGMNFVTGAGVAVGATAPTGTVTIGTVTASATSATVNYTYSGSDATGYQYRLNGGTANTLGASPATISGLTSGMSYTLEVRATNATGNGAWSSAVGFTTAAPAAVAPTGVVTIGTVSVTSSSATVNFTYSASDQTGFQYRLNSGTATTLGNSPATITGLTASTAYNLEVRAVNAAGNGAWSSVKAFTTSSAPVGTGTVTVPATFKRNTGATVSDVSSVSVIVARASDFSPVCNLSGVALSSSGILSPIIHTSIVPGTVYDVWIKDTTGGSVGWFKGATAT